MPPRKKNARGGRFRNGTSPSLTSSTPQAAGSSTRRGAALLASAATSSGNSTPRPSSGRNTQNSKGNRGSARKVQTKKTPNSKPTNGRRGRKKDSSLLQSPASYKAENGDVYKRGDFAYVDSQQPDLPYHICVIRDFKFARKDSIIAEVKWFYRVSELPEAVYCLLMEDRKKCPRESLLFDSDGVRDRELFMAFNVDTHPASLFRGKCHVSVLDDVRDNLPMYLDKENTFFYNYGYKPESRRLTQHNEDSYVPLSQQAVLPECRVSDGSSRHPSSYYSSPPEEKVTVHEELVWKPEQTSDEQLLMYLRAARSIALHAGVCMSGDIADGYLAVSSDETTQNAFDVLQRNNHDTDKALQELIKRPMVSQLLSKKNWTKESAVLFGKGMRQFGKNFFKIKKELLPDKEISELAEYYYYWKKTSAGLSSRSTRRQRKMAHIRLSRALKPVETTPEKEFMDWESCDEEEAELDDTDKAKARSFYACRHCFSQSSTDWHHAGPDKTILCRQCRIYFQCYGRMAPITSKRQPPEFLFKEYHDSTVVSEDNSASPPAASLQATPISGRKTRNSNGSRGSLRPGLRSERKAYFKSDTEEDEEGDASGESCESSGEEEMVHKPKPLQARRSILDFGDSSNKQGEEPPAKRAKREDTAGTLSEEEGSAESTNGEGDQEGSQKSPGGEKSPGDSSSTTSANPEDEEGGSTCSSQADPTQSSVPQQFRRETKNSDSTCARTDLVYIHPPAEEKKMATLPSKVMPQLPGPSNVIRGIGEVTPSSAKLPDASKPPLISQYAPQLPVGPGPPPFLHYPPATPHSGVPAPPVAEVGHIHKQEREELALWQQQQHHQQMVAAALHYKQLTEQQLHQLVVPPGSAHHPAFSMPVVTSHGHASHSVEPTAFTFNPEEIAARSGGSRLHGGMEHLPAGLIHPGQAIVQSTPIPIIDSYQLAMSGGRLPEEHAAAATPGLIPLIQAGVPISLEQQQLMLVQQQQQQQVLSHVAAINNTSLPDMMQFLQQSEMLTMQVQKEPTLLQDPNVQHMLKKREVLGQQIQQVVVQMEQIQRMQQEAILQHQHQHHQELLQKQQQQQFVLTRPPLPEEVHSRNRPGVIVGHK